MGDRHGPLPSDPPSPSPAPAEQLPLPATHNDDAAPDNAHHDSSHIQPSAIDSELQARRRETHAPPFWSKNRHTRSESSVSYQSLTTSKPAAIRLEDHTEESHDHAQSCWAQSVSIDDYVVVSGPTGIGAYVVWHCTVQTLKGGDLFMRKRYSEFDRLREDLVRAFPHAEAMIPELPRKSIVSRFRPKFLEQRRTGLSHFLSCVLLNPEFASSPMLKDFIFY